jgi:hypothetical protein
MNPNRRLWTDLAVSSLAVILGLLVAWLDLRAPFGDDTSQVTVLFWLVSSCALGLIRSRLPWRWALLLGPWVAIVHGVRHALGLPDSMNPGTYTTALILVVVSWVVCLIGAYSGAFFRRALSPSPG